MTLKSRTRLSCVLYGLATVFVLAQSPRTPLVWLSCACFVSAILLNLPDAL